MDAISIIGICAGLTAIATLLVSIGIWIGKRHSFENVTGKAIDRIDISVEKINESIGNIKTNVAVIATGKPVDISQSPTYLNDLGKSISKEMGGKEWAKKKLPISMLKNSKLHNLMMCRDLLLGMYKKSSAPLKKCSLR